MGAWVRRVAVVAVLAVLASGLSLSPAMAQSRPPVPSQAPQAEQAGPGVPEVLKPGAIDRKPKGSPVPATKGQGLLSAEGLETAAEPGEVVERRTEDSTTFVTEDGAFETTFYDSPVNYRDAKGDLQPIDNTLVPAAKPGALRNKAGAVQVSLPAVIGAEPVRASKGATSVAFALRGAKDRTTPSIGVPEGLANKAGDAAASDKEAKASATYDDALPGVDVAYAATPEGVKEDVVLSGPSSPTSFDFTVVPSPGLTAEESGGGIDFVDAEGTTQAAFAAPFAYDAAFEDSGSEESFTEDAVTLRIVERSPQLVVRLAADPAWLSAPGRAWPVVIDPVLTIGGGAADTYLSQTSPDSNLNTNTRLYISGGSADRRIIHAKDIAAFFDEPATLYSATFQLYATTDTSAQPAAPVGLHEMATREWNSGAATWNTRLAPGLRWANPGGDFVAQPAFVNPKVTGAPGWRSWPMTELAQRWLDGTPYSGVMLKYENEASGALVGFASTSETDASLAPRIVVNWEPLEGVRAPYSYEELDLGAAGKASVNVASGNLTLAHRDLDLPGTGLATTVDRFYQSRGVYMASVGARWRMWPQSEERLGYASVYLGDYAHNGDVMLRGSPEEVLVFSQDDTGSYTEANPNGTYTSPPGYRGSLRLTSEAGSPVFKLTDPDTGIVRTFYGTGYLRDVTDASGNKISFGYTCDLAADECYMVSMTDTQGRVTRFQRSAAGPAGEWKVTTVTEPSGRVHRYAYDRSDVRANLAGYTDPTGAVTRYDYSGSVLGQLSRVTDPSGNVTTFTYDSRDRLVAMTRSGSTRRFDYSTPWQTKVTDANGGITTYRFDRQGKVTDTTGPPPPTTTTTTQPPPTTTTTTQPPPSNEILWGVDSVEKITEETLGQVRDVYGEPAVWGRYLHDDGASTNRGISEEELEVARQNDLLILVVDYNPGTDNLIGSQSGRDFADMAISNAQRLGIPGGVAIFADIEPDQTADVDSEWIKGWFDVISASEYEVGYYGDPEDSEFSAAYCQAVSDNASIGLDSEIWSFQPNPGRTTKADAPDFSPSTPPCEGSVLAWQYGIPGSGDGFPAAPNVDTDLVKPELRSKLWKP